MYMYAMAFGYGNGSDDAGDQAMYFWGPREKKIPYIRL